MEQRDHYVERSDQRLEQRGASFASDCKTDHYVERNKIDLKEGNYLNNLETKNILFLENILLNNNKVLIKKIKKLVFGKLFL